jgi:hypothetical protein
VFCMRLTQPSQLTESDSDDSLILRQKRGTIVIFERIGLMFLQIDYKGSDLCRMFESSREECAITTV